MSIAKSKEEEIQAQEFEKLLEEETHYIESLMKAPTETREMAMKMVAPEQAIEMGMELIKRASSFLLKFDGLTYKHKVGLLDKLMEYIKKFKDLLEKYGKVMGIESFSIGVSLTGPSLSFTFKL